MLIDHDTIVEMKAPVVDANDGDLEIGPSRAASGDAKKVLHTTIVTHFAFQQRIVRTKLGHKSNIFLLPKYFLFYHPESAYPVFPA